MTGMQGCFVLKFHLDIASGGVYEIRRHTEGKKHSDYARAAASQAPITAAFHVSPAATSLDCQVRFILLRLLKNITVLF